MPLDPRPGVVTSITLCTLALDTGEFLHTEIRWPWGGRSHTNGVDRCPRHDDPTSAGPRGACLQTYRLSPTPHRRPILSRLFRKGGSRGR